MFGTTKPEIVHWNSHEMSYQNTSKLPVQSWTKKTYFWIFPIKPDKNRFSGKKKRYSAANCYFMTKSKVDFSSLYFLLITTNDLENLPFEFWKYIN